MRPSPPGRTLRYWVRITLKQARENADIKPRAISNLLDIDQSTIYKFERGAHWPDEVDQIVAAYADATGVGDPRDFYVQALKNWRADGEAPRIEDPTERSKAASAAAAQAERKKRHRGQ